MTARGRRHERAANRPHWTSPKVPRGPAILVRNLAYQVRHDDFSKRTEYLHADLRRLRSRALSG
jgi:hypothetical protein